MKMHVRKWVSIVAALALLVTCTVSGLVLPVTAAESTNLLANSGFDAATSGWKDANKNEVAVQTDTDGNKYIQIPADGAVITSPNAEDDIQPGDWVHATFRVRKNAAGKARLQMTWQGGMFTGYAAPYWSISSSATDDKSDGEWLTYSVYAQAKTSTTKVYVQFYMVAAHSTVGMDLDDVTIENLGAVDESTLNLLYAGTMDAPAASLNGTSYEGLFYDGGTIVADSEDAANSVLKMTANGQVYVYPDFRSTEAADSTAKTNTSFKKETLYKLTYRQKGAGTTNPVLVSSRATVLTTEGEPKTASETWKTVTVYFRTTTDVNAAYTIDFRTYGEVYLDDFALYELKDATGIAVNKSTLALEIGASETLTAAVVPTGAYLADTLVWSSNAEGVATVDQTGKVTAVAAGTATITAAAGSFTATCTVTVAAPASTELAMPNGDFNAATSGWKDANKNEVAVQTDTDGNKYIQIPADGAVITSPNATGDIAVGDWVRVTFRVRKNEAGKARLAMNWQGGMFTGYASPYWTISSVATRDYSDGEWFTYTVYGKAKTATTKVTLQFGMVAAHSTVGMDLDDVTVELLGAVDESTLNLLYAGAMDTQPAGVNGSSYDGLFYDGGELVADPADATNSVLKMTANGQVYLYPDIRCTEAASSNTKTSTYFKAETVYKLTYRQKGSGTTNPLIDRTRGTHLVTEGDPKTASEDWKTVTVYFVTTTSLNPNYTIDFRTTGEVYLDDLALYELPAATSLTLNKTATEIEAGKSETLTATIAPAGAYNHITWSSNAESVATVDQTGKITAIAAGYATITAKCGAVSATCVVTVGEPTPATSIELDKTELTLKTGNTAMLAATTKPVGAPAEVIVWTTSDASVATVANGVVTAAATGTAIITATSGTLTASCTVTVVSKAASLVIPQGDVEVAPNNYVLLSADGVPAGSEIGTLTWSSSDTSIVTVDQTGKVTAVAKSGTATVTVKNEDNLSASVQVTVSEYANILPNGDMEAGVAGMFHHLPAEGVSVETVDGNKVLKLSKDYTGGNSITYLKGLGHLRNVMEPYSRYKLTLKYKGAQMRIGYSTVTDLTFVDGVKYWNYKASEDWTEVEIVFDTGAAPDLNSNFSFFLRHYTAVEEDTYIDDIALCKQPAATGLVIAPSAMEILPDESATLVVNTVPANTAMGTVTWTSSDPSIVAVDQKGMVTAIADSGTATITVRNDKNLVATATVTVNEYGNLLKNGDFESGTTNWTPPLDNIREGVGKDGSRGHVLLNSTIGKVESTFYKLPLNLMPATTYEISFDYLLTDKEAEFRLWSGTIGLKIPDRKVSENGEWQHASRTFTTPVDMKLNPGWDLSIAVDAGGDGTAVIDNLCLRLYSSGVEATSIELSEKTLLLIPGRSSNLAVAATPVNGDINRTTWSSSDENVATVEYGVVTGVGKGTATITATTRNGLTATCEVTVTGADLYVADGTFDGDNDAWTMTDVTLTPDIGIQNSKAATLVNGSVLTQSFKGLKPNTAYELLYRYRSAGGKATVTLTNGTTELVKETTGSENRWVQRTVAFTTGELVEDTSVLTFTGLGDVYIENVILAEKASLIDFVVDSVVWDGGDYQVKPGTDLLFAVTVINKGADPVPMGETLKVDICKNGETVQTLTYVVDSPMDTGESVIVMGDATWAAEEGDLVISARANPDLSILELNTNNNTKQVYMRVSDTAFVAPGVAQQAGFTELTFSDEFDSIDTIDTMATGKDGYKWYVTRQWGATTVTRDAYEINDGILTIHDPVPTYGITLTTVDVNTQVGYSWNKGYLEVRCRIPTPRDTYGGGPTVWSFPLTKQYEIEGENNHFVEMDWLEFWGNIDAHPNGYWTISMHETTKDPVTDETISAFTNSNTAVDAMGDKQWHTLGWLWDHNIIQGYMDGKLMFQQTFGEGELGDPIPRIREGDIKTGVFTAMNTQIMCLYLSGSKDVPFEIDYVHIWQGEGGGIVPDMPGQGDETPEITVDISAENFWMNYCTDDWGDSITKVNEENYQYILAGGEYWQYLTADRQAEINALLAANGQPTFEELLTAAQRLEKGEEPYPEESPDTGVATALPMAVSVLALSATTLLVSRKKRKED